MTKQMSALAGGECAPESLEGVQENAVNRGLWHIEVLDRTTGHYRKTRQIHRANGQSNGQPILKVIEGRDKSLVTEVPAGRDAVYFMALWLCGNWPAGAYEARAMLDKQFPSASASDREHAVESYCRSKGPADRL